MKKNIIKILSSILVVGNLFSMPVDATTNVINANNIIISSGSGNQYNTNINSNNKYNININSNNEYNTNINSNNQYNTNINSNNEYNTNINSNNQYNTNIDSNNQFNSNISANDLFNKYAIGGIKLLDNYDAAKNKFFSFYSYSFDNTHYFCDDNKNGYGNWLLTMNTDANNQITKIWYSKYGDTDLGIKLGGNIAPGNTKTDLVREYGYWDEEEVNYDVDVVTYNLFYQNQPFRLTVYLRNSTQKIYGFGLEF